ncbi:MAG: hypothetical protein ACRD0X_01785 [Thermoanaerobaculia bacterium]
MRRTSHQAGEGVAGCLFWAAILGILLLVAFKMAPVKISSSELYDFMVEQAKFAVRTPSDTIKGRVLAKARELELPVAEKNVTVEKAGGRIRLRCTYTVPIDFYVYTYQWRFVHDVDRPIFVV